MKQNWILLIILVVALFVRVYRTDQLLGFYYDQGRDAKVIWDLWHKGKFFLIGPTTGVEGIFLGPFYYYFIAPAYLLGNGNPVWPAVWVAVINVAAIAGLYLIGRRYFGQLTGLLAATIVALSFYLVLAHRWLANPTPLPLFAVAIMWSLLAIVHGQARLKEWLIAGLGIGLSLQLEAASAIFFLPATTIILLAFRRHIKWRWGWVGVMLVAFGVTLLPQIVFDLRHQHLLLNSFNKFLIAEESFRPQLASRLNFYFGSFTSKLIPDLQVGTLVVITLFALALGGLGQLQSKAAGVLMIWWLMPMLGLLFYHGNNGYVWDYYFTGVYPALMLFVAWVMARAWRKNMPAKMIVLALLGIFAWQNIPKILGYIRSGVDGSTTVALGNEKQAVDWVYRDSGGVIFNVDAYVPPVISHSYDYLFLWMGSTKYSRLPESERIPLLYTLYEVDLPHPERLQAWLDRQAGIAQVEKSATFGGITVQRRHRI